MKFLDLTRNRQSVRAYQDKPVQREKIERCLKAGRLAPSARNAQPWQFIVIDDLELRDKVARKTFNKIISFNRFSLQAPVLTIAISENKGIINKIGKVIKNKQ